MWLLRTGGCFKKVIVKAGLTVPWTKIIMRGELLVWEGKQSFRDFRAFRGIKLADLLSFCNQNSQVL